jgi:RNA polymerase sigma-70 factor (ECF subfamily)
MSEFLLRRVAAGEQAAVAEVVRQFGGLVWSLARRLSPTSADAEDAVQEIFLDVWKSAARFDPAQGSEKVFVTMIARRRLIDRLRRFKTEPERADAEELDVIAFPEPSHPGERSVDAERAAVAVGYLKPDQQRVISLAVLHGLTHSEIASETGLPLGTVKTQMRRGLIELRARLGVEAPSAAASLAGDSP